MASTLRIKGKGPKENGTQVTKVDGANTAGRKNRSVRRAAGVQLVGGGAPTGETAMETVYSNRGREVPVALREVATRGKQQGKNSIGSWVTELRGPRRSVGRQGLATCRRGVVRPVLQLAEELGGSRPEGGGEDWDWPGSEE